MNGFSPRFSSQLPGMEGLRMSVKGRLVDACTDRPGILVIPSRTFREGIMDEISTGDFTMWHSSGRFRRSPRVTIMRTPAAWLPRASVMESLLHTQLFAGAGADEDRVFDVLHRFGYPHLWENAPSVHSFPWEISAPHLRAFSVLRGFLAVSDICSIMDNPLHGLTGRDCALVERMIVALAMVKPLFLLVDTMQNAPTVWANS